MTIGMAALARQIKDYAQESGLSMAGIVPARPSPELDAYLRWIKAGMHGSMGYMAREDRIVRRQDLIRILPNAKSLIVVGLEYATLNIPENILTDAARGRISNYAWGLDYHDVLLEKLEQLASFIKSHSAQTFAYRAYVDTGALLERSHARSAGLGFTGKNTMLIHPRRGSYFFLGEIITDLPLPPDEPPPMPHCGSCIRCLQACPTNAFPQSYVLDARRCISYLTIEYKGIIPLELRESMGNWVYGCDICQEVCPWQRFTNPSPIGDAFAPREIDRAAPELTKLLSMNKQTFAEYYANSPVKRVKRERLVRNACIAAGNSSPKYLAEFLIPLLRDDSALIRAHAAWALYKLNAGKVDLARALEQETDSSVRAELSYALEHFGK